MFRIPYATSVAPPDGKGCAGLHGRLPRKRTPAPASLYPRLAAVLADLGWRPVVPAGLVTGASRQGMEAMIAVHGLICRPPNAPTTTPPSPAPR